MDTGADVDAAKDQIVPDIREQETEVDEDGYVLIDMDNIPEDEYKPSNVDQQSSLYSAISGLSSLSVPDMSFPLFNGWWNPYQEAKTKEDENAERKMTYVAEKLDQCQNLPDELEHRTCLAKSLIKHNKKVIEGTRMSVDDFIRMKTEKCIHIKDCEYITEKYSLCSERMHCVFLMMILRDLKTMLVFLNYLNLETYNEIVSTFEELLKGDNNSKMQRSCTWCVITSSVNIVYVVADLLRCGSGVDIANWMKVNMEAMTVICDMEKSLKIWKMVQDIVCDKPELKSEVVDILIESLGECEFHSDVVRLLQEDKNQGKDSFKCMCEERQHVSRDRLECLAEDDHSVSHLGQERNGAEGSVDIINSKSSSLKRKNSECENGFNKKKSLDDDVNRSSDSDKPAKKIDNSKMSDFDDESDEIRLDNLKVGILEYDEGIGASIKSCEPVSNSKNTEETEPKQVWVNIETSTNTTVSTAGADNTDANVDVASSTDTLQPSMSDVPLACVDKDEGTVVEEGQGQSLESDVASETLSSLNESYLMEPSDSNQQKLHEADAFINFVPSSQEGGKDG